jgi:hypothetical protein
MLRRSYDIVNRAAIARLPHVTSGSDEIADKNYGKRDYDRSNAKKEHVSDIMSCYALPFPDIGYHRRWLIRPRFEMIAGF